MNVQAIDMKRPPHELAPTASGDRSLHPLQRHNPFQGPRGSAWRARLHALLVKFSVPLIVLVALGGILLNEVTHQRTVARLRAAAGLVETQVSTAGVLRQLADAQQLQRRYLLHGGVGELDALRVVKGEIEKAARFPRSGASPPERSTDGAAERLAREMELLVLPLQQFLDVARSPGSGGSAALVAAAGNSDARVHTIRTIIDAELNAAAARERAELAAIDRSLEARRLAIVLVIALGALTFGFHVRHLRSDDRERTDLQHGLEDQVKRRTAELRQLANYLLMVREDEKAHLARELHDEMGEVLTAAKLDLARLRRTADMPPGLLDGIAQVNRRLDAAAAIKRRIVEGLRPACLDMLGLKASLSEHCSSVGDRLGIPVHADIDDVLLPQDAQLAVYRFVQEALTNVSKYARATKVWVTVKADLGHLHINVDDDGIGFDAARAGSATHGLEGMRFRIESLNGHLCVVSGLGQGTHLSAVLPLDPGSVGPATSAAKRAAICSA
jgi:signal transduction histidine kinase